MTLHRIEFWHTAARPQPTPENFNVQLGCHFEEVAEMLETLKFTKTGYAGIQGNFTAAHGVIKDLAEGLKKGLYAAEITDRKELLDSLADQIVTAVGVGYCAHMDVPEACERVDDSNWSKYDELGMPIFNEHGKITKGPDYVAPDLTGLY
jgi:hypothetical protein